MNLNEVLFNQELWEYFAKIYVGVVRMNHEDESAELKNEFCQQLVGATEKPNLYKYFVNLTRVQESTDSEHFIDQGKHCISNGHLLSVRSISESHSVSWLFLQDVTEKVRLESIAEAVNIMDNIGYIFSGIRHEIGNPINTIKMTISVLKKNLDGLSKDKILAYIDRSLEAIIRLEDLLQSLKSYNMFDKPKPKNVHLSSFLNNFMSLVERDPISERLNMKVFITGSFYAFIDPRGLQQVLLNVITNSLDALKNSSSPQITLSVYRILRQVCIKVTDNGSGIPKTQMEDLFKPFYTTKAGGTGLGLVISKKILKSMGASIKITSVERQGTTVLLTLPEGEKE